jgi:hypothetical protein
VMETTRKGGVHVKPRCMQQSDLIFCVSFALRALPFFFGILFFFIFSLLQQNP